MTFHRNLAIALMVALACPMAAAAKIPEVPVSDGNFSGLSYEVSSVGEIFVYFGPRRIGNSLAICGFVYFGKFDGTTQMIEPKFTEQITFKIAGQDVRVNTRLFKRYKTKDQAYAGNARCAVTKVAWQPAFERARIETAMGNNSVYN